MIPSAPALAIGFALTGLATAGASVALSLPLLPPLALLGVYAAVTWPRRSAGVVRGGLGPANAITLARAVLVLLLAGWAMSPEPPLPEAPSLLLGTVMMVTFGLDGLDGLVARLTNTASEFGANLDMELDAIVVFVYGALAWKAGVCGPWILLGGLWRYLFVAAGWWLPWMRAPLDDFPPRRVACGLLVGGLSLAVALPQPLALGVAGSAFAVLTGSFARDVAWLWRNR